MRINQPVTGCEHPFPQGKTAISYTNLNDQITRVNDIFAEVSGFTREELIGQPHNMVRHPDMPPEAFRDIRTCKPAHRVFCICVQIMFEACALWPCRMENGLRQVQPKRG